MNQMTRDARGRFNGIEPDPETQKRIDAENRRAVLITSAFKKLGFKAEFLEKGGYVKRWDSGNYLISYRVAPTLQGVILGLAYSLNAGAKKKIRIKTLAQVADSLGYLDDWQKLKSKRSRRAS